jgi:hypothetical protein
MWDNSAIKKTAQSKQSPNGRKFAQSGHPAAFVPILDGQDRFNLSARAKKKRTDNFSLTLGHWLPCTRYDFLMFSQKIGEKIRIGVFDSKQS